MNCKLPSSKLRLLLLFAISLLNNKSYGQSITTARGYYLQGLKYRTGNGVAMDYARAYTFFSKASALGEPRGQYAEAYMLYKGLGCTQDYVRAAAIFESLARKGYDNSMYFYGLCLRNGYGVDMDKDSALYWLHRADSLGSSQAKMEIALMDGENGNATAKQLVDRIHNEAFPQKIYNTFTRIPQQMPMDKAIGGRYSGYLIQYDWGGTHVVSAKKLEVELAEEGGRIKGTWVEEDADSLRLDAVASGDSLRFSDMRYRRKDHYSPDRGIDYAFTNASMNIVRGLDTIFLAGNVHMYSPDRREPSKPMVIALSKPIHQQEVSVEGLKAGPNPFVDLLHITFTLNRSADVQIMLSDMGGRVVYTKNGGLLQNGFYGFDLLPGKLPPGNYLLLVKTGNKTYKIIVLKGK